MSEVITEGTFFNGVIADIAEINPRTDIALAEEERVSFLPMQNTSESGDIIALQERVFAQVSKGYTRFAENDVLVAKITPCFENGKGGYAKGLLNGIGFGSTEFHIVRAIPGKADSRFLHHLTRSERFRKAGEGSMTGSAGQKRIPSNFIKDFPIFIPPLPEQKKIAEILSGIDRAINARRNSAEAIAQIGNFTAEDLFQRTSVAYNSVKIGDCTCRLWQGINTAADKVEYHDRGVPILQAKHVTSGRIDSQGARHLSEEDYDKYSERYQPQTGDILFTNIGTIGKSALVTHRSRFLIAWNIFLISPSEEIIGEYLQHFLQSLDRRNYFHEHAAGNATKFINKTLISELEVPLPPKEQQIKICNQIRAISKAEENDRNTIAKYLELKRSLLIDLLSGRKRVSDARVIDGVGI